MATFKLNEPVTTQEPGVVVDAGLAPGKYVFQLVVVNQQGVRSAPAFATVTVLRPPIIIPPIIPPVIPPIVLPHG